MRQRPDSGGQATHPDARLPARNKRRKLVEIPENLAAWLMPQAKTEGSIMPRAKVQVAMANAVEKAGIEWPHNCFHNNSPARFQLNPWRRKHLICGCSTNPAPREIRQVASKGKSPYHFCQTLKVMRLQKWQTNEIF